MPFPREWVQHSDGSIGPPGRYIPPRQWREPKPKEEGDDYAGVYRGDDYLSKNHWSIPTEYNGLTYRSRIEARWALLFDALGIKYMYEPQVVDTPQGKYLPDFYLPTQDCWVEIKGPHPTWQERDKAMSLAKMSGKVAYIFSCGIPVIGLDEIPRYECGENAKDHSWRFDVFGNEVGGFMFGVKECCGRLGIVYNGLVSLIQCSCESDKYDPRYLYTLQLAFQKARLRRWQ